MFDYVAKKYKSMPLPLKAGIWFAIADFSQRGVQLITTPIFTRLLSKEQYGITSTFVAWQNVMLLFVTLSLQKAMFNLFKDDKEYNKVGTSLASLSMLISVFWGIIGILLSGFLSPIMGISKLLVIFMCISFAPQAIFNCWIVLKKYCYDYKPCLIQAFSSTVLTSVISIIVVLFISATAEAKIIPTIVISCVISAVLYICLLKKNNTFYDKHVWQFSLSFCLPLLPHYLSEFILQSSDKLMINSMCGSEEVAIYSIAYTVGSLITVIISVINNTVIPYRYQKLNEKEYLKLSKVTDQIVVFIGGCLFLIMLFAPEIIYIFGGKEYKSAVNLIYPICMGVFFNFIFQLFASIQEYFEKKKMIAFASVLCAICNIILNLIFIPLYGFSAAAYTTLISYLFFSLLHYCFYRKTCKQELANIKIYNIFNIFLICCFVSLLAIISYLIRNLVVVKIVISILTVILIAFIGERYILNKE